MGELWQILTLFKEKCSFKGMEDYFTREMWILFGGFIYIIGIT